MRLADRSQVEMHFCCIDELVSADHQVRVIWDAVCQMDLSAFVAPIAAREFTEGRPANDVRVMVGLWLWSAVTTPEVVAVTSSPSCAAPVTRFLLTVTLSVAVG